jgi:hypothetical protein
MAIEHLRVNPRPSVAVVRIIRLAGRAVAAMGLIGVVVVLVILGRTWSWHAGTVTASGTVRAHDAASIRTASRPTGRRGARPSYAEVVEFTDTAGARHEFRSWITTSDPFPVGAAVTVRYTPADPADAVIDTWFRVWGFPLVFAAGASLVMLFGIVFASFSRRIEHATA